MVRAINNKRSKKSESNRLTLFVVRVLSRKGKLLGYIGRKYLPGNENRRGEATQFKYVLCEDIISPERKFMRSDADKDQHAENIQQLQEYLKKHKIKSEDAHRCTLKYRRRSDAKKLIKALSTRRRRKYDVVKIRLEWGKPHTARLMSN